MPTIRVILADDHPVVRAGIRAMLLRAPDIAIVAEAEHGAEILPLVRKYVPDVLILDIEMPQLSGVEVAQMVREQGVPVRVLALSAHADEHYVSRVLASGAAGYLVKEEAPEMIIDAVRGVAAGKVGWMSRQAAARLDVFATTEQAQDSLTPREREVLHLMVDGKSNHVIAMNLQISESTVEKHVSSVLTKLNTTSRVEAAVLAVRRGWV